MEKVFHEGELIIYRKGDSFEIGKIKKVVEGGAFVFYHGGETASATKFENMFKLDNAYVISKTILGGVEGEKLKDEELWRIKDSVTGACFHGEVWVKCPHCGTGHEIVSMTPKMEFDRYRIFECDACGKLFKDEK